MSSCCESDNSSSCCAGGDEQQSGTGSGLRDGVREYYAALTSSADLKTSACTAASRPPQCIRDIIKRYGSGRSLAPLLSFSRFPHSFYALDVFPLRHHGMCVRRL